MSETPLECWKMAVFGLIASAVLGFIAWWHLCRPAVEASYALDVGLWSWDLPSPPLESVAGSDGVKTNPDLLRVTVLAAEAPEPSVHWLLGAAVALFFLRRAVG